MRIAVINDYKDLAREAADWTRLSSNHSVDFYTDFLPGGDAAAERLAPYDIVVAAREETLFDRALVERLPNLKLLITHANRNAAFDMAALAERGVTVCGTGYGFANATVEITWGLILSLFKRILAEDRGVREGQWGVDLPLGLTGKTLGLLGLGTLGAGTAAVGKALQMNVVAWSQNLTDERCAEIGVTRVSKDELLEKSDVVSIHLVLGQRTRGLIGAAELARMKRTAYIVNTSRGPIVDEDALIEALHAGTIAGAGLDVFDIEPLPVDHPLRSAPNTVLTPHLGGRTKENFAARYKDCFENVVAWLDGNPIRVMT
jgi:phosphoglycerate dehydrogenase-like enzyme